MIVTPLILLAYAVEGRKRVQATSLDPLFSFVGAALLIASGGMIYTGCLIWIGDILKSYCDFYFGARQFYLSF